MKNGEGDVIRYQRGSSSKGQRPVVAQKWPGINFGHLFTMEKSTGYKSVCRPGPTYDVASLDLNSLLHCVVLFTKLSCLLVLI